MHHYSQIVMCLNRLKKSQHTTFPIAYSKDLGIYDNMNKYLKEIKLI